MVGRSPNIRAQARASHSFGAKTTGIGELSFPPFGRERLARGEERIPFPMGTQNGLTEPLPR